MKYALLLLGIVLAACSSRGSASAIRPTEYRVITLEPDVAFLASPTNVPTQTTLTPTPARQVIAQGTIINDDAVLFAEAKIDATEIGIVPVGTVLDIFAATQPNRIGVIFYQVTYQNITGWIANTQLLVRENATPGANPVTASVTPTFFPSATLLPTMTPTLAPTALPQGFPTPEVYSVVLVEQIFERGRMIWFQPIRQVWVLVGDAVDPTSGTWECFLDDYVEGQPERDPRLDPPAGVTTSSLFEGAVPTQPIRGFGKIWRENPGMREALGWALTPETLHTTRYEYHAGGDMQDGAYEPAPGEYRIESLYQYTLVLQEDTIRAPCETKTGTWEIQ